VIPNSGRPIPEWHHVDVTMFRNEILAGHRPAVLRGLVRHWPAVRQALASPEAVCRYLSAFDSGNTWNSVLVPPEWQGRMFYEEGLTDFNFVRDKLPVSAVLSQINVLPKEWTGNRFITPAHFDEMNNIACVLSGRRRFTLLPPEQVANLYIGRSSTRPPAHR
jgi:hypothetical protein